jgi:LuxR family transcriptional regulator
LNHFDFIDQELPKIGEIATAGYFLALRIRGSSPMMAFHTYPQRWVDEYNEKAYLLRDPVTTWAMTIGGTVRWSSPLLPDPFRIFRKAATYGLNYGASIARGRASSLTICSVARSDRELTDEEISAVDEIVVRLHDRVAIPQSLTEEQKAVLSALAKGSSARAISTTLGVPESVAEAVVRKLCHALIARSPEEALQRARDYKLL